MWNNKIKLSIIVPVYKAEKYLEKCINTLEKQTLKEIEIICVNDNSPDRSLEILEKFKKEYNNLTIIDKEKNEGVWKARLDGIKMAKGEYIGFIDSDDYIELNYAEKMYTLAKKEDYDILVCGFDRVEMETSHIFSTEMIKKETKISMKENPENIISVNTALWNKIYKSEILKNVEDLEKPPRVLEDMMFLCLIYPNVKEIGFLPEVLYHYMVRRESAINTIQPEEIENIEESMIEVKKKYETENKELLPILDIMAFLHFGISLMFRISSNDNINFSEELRKNKKYLDENFPTWKNSRYLKISYCIKNKANLKVAIMNKIYKSNLFKVFMNLYNFMINKLKIDIKW